MIFLIYMNIFVRHISMSATFSTRFLSSDGVPKSVSQLNVELSNLPNDLKSPGTIISYLDCGNQDGLSIYNRILKSDLDISKTGM